MFSYVTYHIDRCMNERRPAKAASITPRPEFLLATIRQLARSSDNVAWSDHALDRMDERGITDKQALEVLRNGDIEGGIVNGNNRGEWKCKVVAPVKGNREVGVVTIVIKDRQLLVKTVEWEDL